MLAHFGVDTLDPETSLRRVAVLLDRLPPGSVADARHEMSWSYEAYLLAQLIDEVASLHYTTVRAHGGKPKRPKPFPRPGTTRQKPREKQRSSWAALADSLAATKSPKIVVHDG